MNSLFYHAGISKAWHLVPLKNPAWGCEVYKEFQNLDGNRNAEYLI
jgi:hypothetical protein